VFINLFRGQKAPSFVVSASISLLSVYWMYQKGWYLDQSLIFPILIAGVTFGAISLILVKGFRINRALSAIIAGVISGVVAFGIYDSGLGISSDILLPIISFLLIGGLIIAIWKFGFSWSLIIMGLALLMTTFFTDIFYEEGLVTLIGFVLLVIGLLLAWRNRGRGSGGTDSGQPGVIGRGSRWLGRGVNATGGRIARGTIGRTKLTKGRFMSKKRAEEAAYREEAIREEKIRRKISDSRRLEAEMENARIEKERKEEQTRQQYIQQEQLRKQQRKREKIEIKSNKEEARREKAQQKQLEKEQEKRGKIEMEAHQEEARRQRNIEKAHKEELKENQIREEEKRREEKKQQKARFKAEAKLTEEQEKRLKKRDKYLREINKQLKAVEGYLRRDLSEETRRNFEQRRQDLLKRKDVFSRYTPSSGNL